MKRTMKLGTRIALGFTCVLILLLIIIGLTIYYMSNLSGQMKKIVEENFNKIELTSEIKEQLNELYKRAMMVLVISDEKQLQREMESITSIRQDYLKSYSELLKTPNRTEKGKILRDRIKQTIDGVIPIYEELLSLGVSNKKREAVEYLSNTAEAAMENVLVVADEYLALLKEYNAAEVKTSEQAFANALIMMATLGAIGIVLGILLTIFITRGITNSINRIVDTLAEGSNQVAEASNQLSATSQQLAEGSAKQSTSLEETSSTLEEASSMIQQNTENTKQAASLSDQTKQAVDKGNIEMQNMIASMNEIKKSSDQISKVIKVIDDIAFQTNILALNAAVEAARAGEAGLGFAVVAEEVRNLAQRSAQAAMDTAAMIENNIELSEKGVTVTQKVKEGLNEVTVQIRKISELMAEITTASQEQSQGISQINSAITQMETVVQQNAASAEESASASEELSTQALNLKEMVQQLVLLVHGKVAQKYESLLRDDHSSYQVKLASTVGHVTMAGKDVRQLKGPVTNSQEKRTRLVSREKVIPLGKDDQGF